MDLLRVVAFIVGALLVARAILSALRTFVLPRASNDPVTRAVFHTTRRVFDLFAGSSKPYARRDRLMAYFGPVSLIVLPSAGWSSSSRATRPCSGRSACRRTTRSPRAARRC